MCHTLTPSKQTSAACVCVCVFSYSRTACFLKMTQFCVLVGRCVCKSMSTRLDSDSIWPHENKIKLKRIMEMIRNSFGLLSSPNNEKKNFASKSCKSPFPHCWRTVMRHESAAELHVDLLGYFQRLWVRVRMCVRPTCPPWWWSSPCRCHGSASTGLRTAAPPGSLPWRPGAMVHRDRGPGRQVNRRSRTSFRPDLLRPSRDLPPSLRGKWGIWWKGNAETVELICLGFMQETWLCEKYSFSPLTPNHLPSAAWREAAEFGWLAQPVMEFWVDVKSRINAA